MSLPDEIARQLDGKSNVLTLVGTFVGVANGIYVVDVGGNRIPADLGSSYLPEVNESVWVWFIDGVPFVKGPTTFRPDRGTVVSVASGIVTLSTAAGNIGMKYTGTTPSAGQVMGILWHGGPTAFLLSTSPAGNTPPPAPGGGGAQQHVDRFAANTDSGSWRSGNGWWTSQIRAGDTNLGAWFYGTKIADTLPSGATIQRVQIWISGSISGAAPNFALHPHASRPGGAPSLSGSTAIGVSGGWVDLPLSFGQALRNGNGSYGVGINHGGNSIFNSVTDDGQSGTLVITSTY